MFKVSILNPKRVLFQGEAWSVFVGGDQGEFELLEYHSPILSILNEGEILIDQKKFIKIKGGILRFHHNELVVLVEE